MTGIACELYDWGWALIFIAILVVMVWLPFRLARNLGEISKNE